jgi:hypothetical protein
MEQRHILVTYLPSYTPLSTKTLFPFPVLTCFQASRISFLQSRVPLHPSLKTHATNSTKLASNNSLLTIISTDPWSSHQGLSGRRQKTASCVAASPVVGPGGTKSPYLMDPIPHCEVVQKGTCDQTIVGSHAAKRKRRFPSLVRPQHTAPAPPCARARLLWKPACSPQRVRGEVGLSPRARSSRLGERWTWAWGNGQSGMFGRVRKDRWKEGVPTKGALLYGS